MTLNLLPKLKERAESERANLAAGEKPKSRFQDKLQATAVRLLCGFFALMLALTLLSRAADGVTVPRVSVESPKTGVLTQRVTGRGAIEPLGDLGITLPGGVLVDRVVAEVGQRVEAGGVLLELSVEDLAEQARTLEEKLRILELRRSSAAAGKTSSGTDGVLEAQRVLAEKEEDLLRLQEKLTRSDTRSGEDSAAIQGEYEQALIEYDRAVEKAEKTLVRAADQAIQDAEDSLAAVKESAEDAITAAQSALESAEEAVSAENDRQQAAAGALGQAQSRLSAARAALEALRSDPSASPEAIAAAEAEVAAAEAAVESALSAMGSGSGSADSAARRAKETLQRTKDRWGEKVDEAEAKRDEVRTHQESKKKAMDIHEDSAVVSAQNALDGAEKAIRTQVRSTEDGALTAQEQLLAAQRAIEEARRGIEKAEREAQTSARSDADSRRQSEIEGLGYLSEQRLAQKTLDQLKELVAAEGKLTAPVAGVVQSMMETAGKTQDGVKVAVLSRSDQGFTFTCDITQDEAEKLAVGDEARLSYTHDGKSETAQVKVTAIGVPDEKGLTQVEAELPGGNWPAGASGELEVSKRSSQYDTSLPVSALRGGGNDSFVLVLRERQTVMGTEHTVEKVAVKVLDQDSERMAVQSDALQRDDKVIVTASKPISQGDRVRLEEKEQE